MVLGLNLRRNSRSQTAKKKEDDEDQWHIRYTGPYEPPRETPRPARPRDSWGDPLDGEDDEDVVIADKELHGRFREYQGFSGNGGGRVSTDEDQKARGRDRSFSLMSGRTVSSGAIDPVHSSVLAPRRSTVSSTQPPPVPAYIHLDPNGGVGESPAPHLPTRETNLSSRLSLASIFTFGSSSRKNGRSPSRSRRGSLRKSRPAKVDTTGTGRQQGDERMANLRQSISSEDTPIEQQPLVVKSRPSQILEVTPDDYYNSYYSTLIPTLAKEVPVSNQQTDANAFVEPPSASSTASRQGSLSPNAMHPYAYTFPKRDIRDPPPTAPMASNSPQHYDRHLQHQRLAFADQARRQGPSKALSPPQLKNSTSTPNLRNNTPSRQKPYTPPSIKDRWLSAETWCDAILFPRPRFKVKENTGTGSSGRIVSPPDSPIDEKFAKSSGVEAVPSRVLAHSRSLGNLKAQKQLPIMQVHLPQPSNAPTKIERPPRPKSFAADDLALINPAFSLEQVLEEGQELEYERKQWQIKAASSLGNSRARSLARTRSKSLTQKGRKVVHEPQTSIDYLAARACLGSQALDVVPPRPRTASSNQGTTSFSTGRTSHSHSNSLVKTLSKTSKHSRSHSHSESWNKSAKNGHVKGSSCGRGVDMGYTLNLEGALRREDTKIIRLPDPALIPVDTASPPRVSPMPSVNSDVQMGIAISTPPPPDDLLDLDSIRMPAHPYAQAGLYTMSHVGAENPTVKRSERVGADYAGPHPSVVVVKPSDVVRNNRDAASPASNHPYARAVSPEMGLVAQTREESTVPVQEKMWAQLSPGVIREVLPEDLSYSPFLPEGRRGHDANKPVSDSVSLGEALSYTNYRDSHDSGIGTSENHIIQPYIPSSSPHNWPDNEVPRVLRKPVQYDVTRPPYAIHASRVASNTEPEHALPSSDLLLTIPEIDRGQSDSPAVTSGTPSPQTSPRSIGSPNNLDDFHDLFYQPSSIRQSTAAIEDRPMSQTASLTWEVANRSRRTGSGLASLARQLSEEFEQLERERTNSEYSSGSFRYDDRAKTNTGLRFVFEEELLSTSPTQGEFPTEEDTNMLIKPSFNIPEDVASFVGSTEMEKTVEDEDETAVLRVGTVEPVSTPPTESGARRLSFVGLMSYDNRSPREHTHSAGHLSTFSGLHPHSDAMRSSYMTTSTTSRISGLSDFPSPPKDGDSNMSLLAAYFDDPTLNNRDFQDLRETPYQLSPNARATELGIDQEDSRTDTTHTQR